MGMIEGTALEPVESRTATPGARLDAVPAVPVQAESDERLVEMWLHGKSPGTRRAYAADAAAFLAHVGKPLRAVTLGDVQGYMDGLAGLATATVARRINGVKSLLGFAHRLGYLTFNVGAAVKAPKIKATLAERIMEEGDVLRLLVLESDPRNKALLTLLYAAGLRISEAAGLKVRDMQPRGNAGQITVFGKGGKTRVILLSVATWRLLAPLAEGCIPDDAVFRSRQGGAGHLTTVQIHRVVKVAAARAGLSEKVSAHWLRHAHATYALQRTKDVALTQATLGHASLATTSKYVHARPDDSTARHLGV